MLHVTTEIGKPGRRGNKSADACPLISFFIKSIIQMKSAKINQVMIVQFFNFTITTSKQLLWFAYHGRSLFLHEKNLCCIDLFIETV